MKVDPARVIPDKRKSIRESAIKPAAGITPKAPSPK